MKKPFISVVVPTYNRSGMLSDALQTLVTQQTGDQFSYEIVVVDNASTDSTKEVIEQAAAEAVVPVRYVYHEVHGDAPPRNRAIAESRGEWLAFFDDDQLAAPDWLLRLYQASRETGAPVIGGAVQLHLPEDVLSRLGLFIRRTSCRETEPCSEIRPFVGNHGPGCGNALVARWVFDTIGTFDASKKYGGSDRDLFMRARAAGMSSYHTPYAVVRHRIPPNRITQEYLRWDARQGCSAFAGLDCHFKGRITVALLCIARILHALLVVAPRLAWAWIRNQPGEVLGERVRLWRTEGYVRGTLAQLAPTWFPQKRFFEELEFRRGREIGQKMVRMEVVS